MHVSAVAAAVVVAAAVAASSAFAAAVEVAVVEATVLEVSCSYLRPWASFPALCWEPFLDLASFVAVHR